MKKYWSSIYSQLIKFSITGLINTLIDFMLFNLLLLVTNPSNPWQVAFINLCSVGAAATNSFFMNRRWTFAAVSIEGRQQISRFVGATLIGLLINTLVVALISSWGQSITVLPAYLVINSGKVMGALAGSSWNFISYRFWVFASMAARSEFIFGQTPKPGLISLIIPAYNEAARLPARWNQLKPLLTNHELELIFVDDGSSDDTALLIQSFISTDSTRVKLVSYEHNQGKGAAVASGMKAAMGEYLIFSDADTTFTREHITRVIKELQTGCQVVIGCRERRNGSRMQGETRLRRIMGQGFNLLVQLMVMPGINDTQCGLKGFSRPAAQELFSRQKTAGFAFDVELLALAQRLGYAIKTIAVDTRECAGSSVKCFPAAWKMGMDLLRIRWRLSFNHYGLPGPNAGFSWFIALGLFTAALAVRLPWLWEVPRYIDELKEVNLAYLIYLGQAVPLTNVAHDIGSLHNWVLAGIFKLLGPSIYLPRLYVAVTSALSVVLVYEIGRRWFGKTAGLLAAGLLMTNGMHIMVTHMAWSNSSTPFFFLLALLALIIAEQKNKGWWLVISFLGWAAVLQTHSSGVIYLLAAVIYVLSAHFRRQARIGWKWYLAAGLAMAVGYANMIYFNIISRGGSISWVTRKTYALETDPGIASYLNNCSQMGIELLRSIGSVYADPANWNFWWPGIWFAVIACLVTMGILSSVRKGVKYPLLVIICGFLIIPWINERYTFYLATRYIMPIIICTELYLAVGILRAGEWGIDWLKRLQLDQALGKQVIGLNVKSAGTVIVTGIILLLLGLQLNPFYRFCDRVTATNESNRMALSIMNTIAAAGNEKPVILLDNQLPLENQPLPYLLRLSRQPYVLVQQAEKIDWQELKKRYPTRTVYAIISSPTYTRMAWMTRPERVHQFQTRISIPSPSNEPRQVYVLRLSNP